jgi:carotenoid 1,2-hydratase
MNAVTDTRFGAPATATRLFPRFDDPVAANGYRWWYVDALSDDGRHGLTLIVFVGSVFSPFYAAARRLRPAEPLEHCAVNVALYGQRQRWALTERRMAGVASGPRHLAIGPNSLHWNGDTLVARIDERGSPFRMPIRGELRIHPESLTEHEVSLDSHHAHHWWPVAPASRIEVELAEPALRWSGRGYFDSNRGVSPLEEAFANWTWSRALTPEGTRIHYDVNCRDGARTEIAALVRPSGAVEDIERPARAHLPPTLLWRIPRETRSDDGRARVLQTLEDTPFYSRSVVSARQGGREVTAVHESLSLDRFASRWVQHLIPYRMRRI